MPVLLEASALTVVRGRRTVLSGVNLELAGGRAVHLTGVNGSGKTSLLRVLGGLASPRAGRVVRTGACAFVPEKVTLASALRPGEWLAAMRRLRGLAAADWPAAAEASGLDPSVLGRSSATLSKGMLQRIALLEALHCGCPLLLLDEPFAGLDPEGRDWAARTLAERLEAGAAVLLTDHSGAAGERLAPAQLRLRDGGIEPVAPAVAVAGARGAPARREPAVTAATAASAHPERPDPTAAISAHPDRPPPERPDPTAHTLTVTAVHSDGRRLERAVPEAAGDDLLRALLAAGWHIEAVRR